MSLSFVQIALLVEDGDLVYAMADGSPAPIAVQIDGRWILLDDEKHDRLRAALRSGRSVRKVLAGWPEAPVADRTDEPSDPSLVFEFDVPRHRGRDRGARPVGAWLPVERPRVEERGRRRVRSATRRGGGPAASEPELAQPADLDQTTGAGAPDSGLGPPPDPAPVIAAEVAPASPAGERTIERTPHLDAPERIAKAPGTEFLVSVYADSEALREGESGEGVAITLPAGVDSVDVAVLLQVTPPFEIVGDQFGELTLAEKEPKSNVLEFKTRVGAEAPDSEAGIGVLFNYRGHSCGYVARTWQWDNPEPEAIPATAQPAGPASIPVHADADEPDLSVFVTAPLNDGVNYVCAVETPRVEGYTTATSSEPFAVPAQGYEFLKKLFTALTDEDKSPEKRLRALTEIGHEAFEAAPSNFKQVLWAMVDAGKPPETVYIASSQPTLPWELMIPRRFDGKEPKKLGPLGTEFAIGRWTRGDSVSPSPRLPVDNSFVIAPEYESEARRLDAKAEIEFVQTRLNGERVQPATIDGLDARFERDHAALLHFVCHGAAGQAEDDAIWLDKDEELRAREMETLAGFEKLCEAKKPLVFMNSCETGQGVPSLGGGSGFPRSFGNLGARAVIAPLWPVDDVLASKIALELYESALKSDAPPIAVILRDMRKRGYEAKDVDTFAAYCFYGDPLARLELTG
jgi:CHAT domain